MRKKTGGAVRYGVAGGMGKLQAGNGSRGEQAGCS